MVLSSRCNFLYWMEKFENLIFALKIVYGLSKRE